MDEALGGQSGRGGVAGVDDLDLQFFVRFFDRLDGPPAGQAAAVAHGAGGGDGHFDGRRVVYGVGGGRSAVGDGEQGLVKIGGGQLAGGHGGDDGYAEKRGEFGVVDDHAVLIGGVSFVEDDDGPAVAFEDFERQVEVALEVEGVDDDEDDVGRFGAEVLVDERFRPRGMAEAVDAGEVGEGDVAAAIGYLGGAGFGGFAAPVADELGGAGEGVKE